MTTFDKAFDYTMDWEGGSKYTNDPDDPGGETIARRTESRKLKVGVSPCCGKKSGGSGPKTIGMR